jgi:hypothetical protein
MSALFDAIDANGWLLDAASILALGLGVLWLCALALRDFARAWRDGGDV